jgi:hypothetical protein
MQDPQPPAADVDHCVTALRTALAAHGITDPSLRADLPTFAGTYSPPAGLVALGNCNTVTARKPAGVLRGGLDLDLPATPRRYRISAVPYACIWGDPAPTSRLCVTELVANVIRHVREGTPVRVRVARVDGGRVRVEVTDPDTRALPVLVHATGDDEAGRGLALLDAVALRWGVEQEASGKTVWCELAEGE